HRGDAVRAVRAGGRGGTGRGGGRGAGPGRGAVAGGGGGAGGRGGPAGPVGPAPGSAPGGTSMRALVVIPTYNEAESMVEVLDRVLQAEPRAGVLGVGEGSPGG